MKRYVRANSGRQTLREYINSNRAYLASLDNIVIADLTPYWETDPTFTDRNEYDCPGVLFDGTLDYLEESTPVDHDIPVNDWPGDNYLTQTDIDTATVVKINPYSDNSVEIIIRR
jgi:hypothetical protein